MNKILKRTLAGLTGLAAVGGATAVAVSCGASQKIYPFKVYSYAFVSSPVSVNLKGPDLRLWIPFKNDVNNAYYPLAEAVRKLLNDAGYNVKTTVDETGGVGYSDAAHTYGTLVQAQKDLLPDVVINYPDLQALFVSNGLGQKFDLTKAKSNISSALHFDITSVLAQEEAAYALPIFKSTELTYFNVPAFAMVLNDLAAQKSDTDKVKFAADSAQSRMLKMIKNAAATGKNVHQNVYAETKLEDEYSWAEIKSYWTNLTKKDALWAEDAALLRTNFTLSAASRLKDLDFTKRYFETYVGMADYVKVLNDAYDFRNVNNDKGILGVDSATNTVYAYQYDAAGHNPDNFIITIDKQSTPPKLNFDYRDKITTGTGESAVTSDSPAYQAFSYLSGLQASRSIFVRDQKGQNAPYTTDLMQKHQLFLGWRSSSGVGRVAAADTVKNYLNNGEIYFDYQPTSAGIVGEKEKKTIINQGPSIFVTKVHPDESEKIANTILKAFEPGGAFTSKIVNNKDEGFLKGKDVGYIYADASDYASGSSYLKYLSDAIVSSDNWPSTIGKYLLSQYYSKVVSSPDKYDAFANPAGNGTSGAREQIDLNYRSANVNGVDVSAAAVMQAVLRTIVPDARLS